MNIINSFFLISLKKNFAYPANCFFIILDDIFDLAGIWIFWNSLFALGLKAASWNYNSLTVFMGFSFICTAISAFFIGTYFIEYYILNGGLDLCLVKPINPILYILLERANFFRISFRFLLGLGFVIYGLIKLQALRVLIPALIICTAATVAIENIRLTVSFLSFKIGKVYELLELSFSFLEIKKYPLSFFPAVLQKIFIYVIPVMFTATVPARLYSFSGGKNYFQLFIWIIVLGIQFFLSYILCNAALKKGLSLYESAV